MCIEMTELESSPRVTLQGPKDIKEQLSFVADEVRLLTITFSTND